MYSQVSGFKIRTVLNIYSQMKNSRYCNLPQKFAVNKITQSTLQELALPE